MLAGVAACAESCSAGIVVPRLPIAVQAASAHAARSMAARENGDIRGQDIAGRIAEKQTARRVTPRRRNPTLLRSARAAAETSTAATTAEAARPRARTARAGPSTGAAHHGLWLAGKQAFALHLLAREFARATDRFRPFTRLFLGGLFIMAAKLHFAENALALHLLLERLESLVDVVVSDENLQKISSF